MNHLLSAGSLAYLVYYNDSCNACFLLRGEWHRRFGCSAPKVQESRMFRHTSVNPSISHLCYYSRVRLSALRVQKARRCRHFFATPNKCGTSSYHRIRFFTFSLRKAEMFRLSSPNPNNFGPYYQLNPTRTALASRMVQFVCPYRTRALIEFPHWEKGEVSIRRSQKVCNFFH